MGQPDMASFSDLSDGLIAQPAGLNSTVSSLSSMGHMHGDDQTGRGRAIQTRLLIFAPGQESELRRFNFE